MKVTFLTEQYKCGSNLGIYFADTENLISKLNDAVDFDGSEYPKKWVETEDGKAYHPTPMERTEVLGEDGKIKEGTMFVYEGQVFAVDSDKRLIVTLSETGALSAERFVTEILEAELEMINSEEELENFKAEKVDGIPVTFKESESVVPIPYYKGKIWREKLGDSIPDFQRVTFESPNAFGEIEFWIDSKKLKVWYDPKIVFPDQAPDLVSEYLGWTFKNTKKDSA